jgi:hypothetical protein
MEQRVVIHFFTLKRRRATAIHTELESVYNPEALALPVVKKSRTYFHRGRTDMFDDPRSGKPLTNGLARAIGFMLEERSFNLCKVLCRHFRIGKATCLRILHGKLDLNKFHLQWVPHALVINQESERVLYSKFLSF